MRKSACHPPRRGRASCQAPQLVQSGNERRDGGVGKHPAPCGSAHLADVDVTSRINRDAVGSNETTGADARRSAAQAGKRASLAVEYHDAWTEVRKSHHGAERRAKLSHIEAALIPGRPA